MFGKKLGSIKKKMDLSSVITVYFILKPLYIFDSGLPQISDIFLLSSFVIYLFSERMKIKVEAKYKKWVNAFIIIAIYQAVIDFLWWVKTGDNGMMVKALYYGFIMMSAVFGVCICNKVGYARLKASICKGCFYSSLVTAVGFIINRGSSVRAISFFNNPNQLGYYSLLIITIVLLFPDQLYKWQSILIVFIGIIGSALSLSKASILGMAVLAICYSIWGTKKKSLKKALIQAFLYALFFAVVYWIFFSDSRIVYNNSFLYMLRNRILNMNNENDTELGSGRGYDRIYEMGIHFLWGMGEGAFYRYESLNGYEVHSTYINLLVSYGVIGFASYFWLLIKALNRKGSLLRNIACFSGVLVYGITHNGIRNTLLWIVIATVLLSNSHALENKNESPQINERIIEES